MAVAPGTRLGAYEVTAQIGAGGMGEVYRARDTKLDREVAIKVLPELFVADPERVARFQREAKTLAAVNHPNIGSIYGLEDANGVTAIVLELVEGPTLADRIAQGPIPLAEALPIARQICEALEAAHEQGIIHRDLKPANIKVRADGTVKVLDFGLAKALDGGVPGIDASLSPTLSIAATQAGVILGTAAYMAPEQARGKAVDKRADIWAFGCVLFEMLAGAQPFSGETLFDVTASILARDVNWSSLPPHTPQRISHLLKRCLEKDVRRRLRDIGDARLDIDDAMSAPVQASAVHTPQRRTVRAIAATAVVAVLVLVAGIAALFGFRPREAPTPEWSGVALGGPAVALAPRPSPDGRLVAFLAMVDDLTQVAVMQPDTGNWTVLTHDRTHGYVTDTSWSSDGTKIFYGRADGVPTGIFSISSLGGEERLLLENANAPETLPDGSLIIVRINAQRRHQYFHYWPDSGRLEPYPAFPTATDVSRLRVVASGQEAIFIGRALDQPASDADSHLYALNVSSSQVTRVPATVAPLFFALTPDGTSMVTVAPAGDMYTVSQVPRDGTRQRPLLHLMDRPYGAVGFGPDGSFYVDQFNRPLELMHLNSSGADARTIATLPHAFVSAVGDFFQVPAALPDGRVVAMMLLGGRRRLVVVKEGGEPVSLAQTNEETSGPVTLVGGEQVAFIVGSGTMRQLAIASISSGQIVRRLSGVDATNVASLASSPDGRMMYFVVAGKIWSIPSAGGEVRFIRDGDSVAVDPHGQYLVVQLNEDNGVRLVRRPLDGTPETPLNFPGVRLVNQPLAPSAVATDGTIVKAVSSRDSWFYSAAVLHPDTGKTDRIATPPGRDVWVAGRAPDGSILVSAYLVRGALWRFKPAS